MPKKVTYQIYDPKSKKVIFEDENPQKVIDQARSYEKLNKELGIIHELRMKIEEYRLMHK